MYVGKPEPLVLSWLDNLCPLIWSRWNSLPCRPVPWWRFNECEWDGALGAKTEGAMVRVLHLIFRQLRAYVCVSIARYIQTLEQVLRPNLLVASTTAERNIRTCGLLGAITRSVVRSAVMLGKATMGLLAPL
jgi:hypothetical protein